MYTYTDSMATKTISIMDDVYERLKALKSPDESFSDTLRRITSSRADIMEFAGAWKHISDTDAEKMLVAIKGMKRKTGIEDVKKRFLS